MKIAFYAPMNAPDVGAASGDRSLARLFMRALREMGHDVVVAPRAVTYANSPEEQDPLIQKAMIEATEMVGDIRGGRVARPDLWFTYHVYYRAPDLFGPLVSGNFDLPYVIAEASDAPKQRYGGWAESYAHAHKAIEKADLVFSLTKHDHICLSDFVAPSKLAQLPPFIDAAPFRAWRGKQTLARAALKDQLGSVPDGPILVTVGMMRHRKKLASYQMLASALAPLVGRPWTLLIVGDGPARPEVETAFGSFGERVRFLGALPPADLPQVLGACDLFVWPGVDEAFGLVFLEAQATGLPVVAQHTRGIPSVVENGVGGLLTPAGDLAALSNAILRLIDGGDMLLHMGVMAAARVDERHTLERAIAKMAPLIAGLSSK